MSAVFKKEIRTYFTTMSGYVFLGFFVLINAYFFSRFNVGEGSPDYSGTLTYTFSDFSSLSSVSVFITALFSSSVSALSPLTSLKISIKRSPVMVSFSNK